jgi:hypothetical protein
MRELRVQHAGRPYRILYDRHLADLKEEGTIDG